MHLKFCMIVIYRSNKQNKNPSKRGACFLRVEHFKIVLDLELFDLYPS